METDEQREKRLSCYRERRKYLNNVQNTMNQDLNSQQQQPQQTFQESGVSGADGTDGAETHDEPLGGSERKLLKKF